MTIIEWFARAVAAGLMSDDENISGRIVFTEGKRTIILFNESKEIYRVEKLWNSSNTIVGNDVQLRQNNKDLYSLEWGKPTLEDIGKHIWILERWFTTRLSYIDCSIADFDENGNNCTKSLLADHGQIAPTEADFKRIYGE